jgi:hypothetical protein
MEIHRIVFLRFRIEFAISSAQHVQLLHHEFREIDGSDTAFRQDCVDPLDQFVPQLKFSLRSSKAARILAG